MKYGVLASKLLPHTEEIAQLTGIGLSNYQLHRTSGELH